MSNDLIIDDEKGKFTPERYNQMRRAISSCASIDDCLKAQSIAAAMSTYYHQINDDEASRKLDEIRLCAWRKMSEIVSRVDVSKCSTQKKMVENVRSELGDCATSMLTDSRILTLIKLAGIPDRNFEAEVTKVGASLEKLIYCAHPDKLKERDEEKKRQAQWEATSTERKMAEEKAAGKAREREMLEASKRADAVIKMVKENAIAENPEVGLTLTPKARASLVTFSIMMDKKMHDQLRDAAHERRTTMWAILREASNYWFVVNGYDKV